MKGTMAAVFAGMALASAAQSVDEIYQASCAGCHGKNFEGGNAQSMVDGVWQFGSERGQIAQNIRFGIAPMGMPSFGETLSAKQITELAAYLLDAEKKAGAAKPPPPTRLQTLDYDIHVEVWASGLQIPWGIAFIDAENGLITERPGSLRVVQNVRLLPEPVKGTPAVVAEGQGGLLDVAVDPNYRDNRWIYLGFSHGIAGTGKEGRAPAMTKIVRGRIVDHAWTDEQTLFEADPASYKTTRIHFGTRIVFDPAGHLYFGIGERGEADNAQNLALPNGKIHRINRDGTVPADNPFADVPGALPTIFSFGHRNPQGLAVHPETGRVWESEHGPLGGDEINLITPGANYGWPVITYGRNYNGTPVSDLVRKEGMEQPVWYWRPSTAVCGIDFYHGNLFPKWNGKLLAGALKYEDVRLLDIEKTRVMHEEIVLKNAGRVRDVACGPDGAVYVVLNSPDIVLRLTPADPSAQPVRK